MSEPFSDEQKQYLSGFTFGVDVARAVQALPVLSQSPTSNSVDNSAASNGAANLAVGGGPATLNGLPMPVGPERIALEAQARTESDGQELCKEEIGKRDKNPLDMWDEIATWSDQEVFPKGIDVFLTKWQGLFYVAPAQKSYMCRMRIPGGLLHGWQLRGVADLSDRSAGGFVDVTTRANLQIREIPAGEAMNVLYGLRELDIIPLGSGGDNIRNCTASPLSGVDPDELIETIPLAKRMHHHIMNHREMYGLPRKFNIAFDGGGRISALDDTNDIGFHAVSIKPESASDDLPAGVYFQLTLGGITGHKDFARPTGVLLRPEECVEVAGEIVRVFVKHGDRTDRKKARLKYVLDAWGFDKFIDEVEQGLGRKLRRVAEDRLTKSGREDRMAHVGVHPQSQPGKNYVGVVLAVGRMTSEQTRGVADIAEEFGNGEIRLTVWQNLLIPNVHDSDVAAVVTRLQSIGLDCEASSFRAGLVACTGNAGCKFAASDTKRHAMEIAEVLQSSFQLDQPINIHLTGCHHSCAQHYIGDIGLLACKVERGDDMVEGYHVHLGGGWGDRQGIGRLLFESVAMSELPSLMVSIVGGYLERRETDESFVEFAARHSDGELRQLADPALV